jgi:hypothetical protein
MNIKTAVCSRPRARWQMSIEEEKQMEGQLIARYLEAKRSLTLLEHKASEFSKTFAGFASVVHPDKIWNLSLEPYEHIFSKETYAEIQKLKADIEKGSSEVGELKSKIDDAGLGQFLK